MPEHDTISRVVLRNYKSIRECDVALGPITFLVGPNGAGKSNFVEALRFLSYGLSTSLEQAVASRSGFRSIVNCEAGEGSAITFEVSFTLRNGRSGSYLLEIGAMADGPVTVTREECLIQSARVHDWFKVGGGVVTSTDPCRLRGEIVPGKRLRS